MQGLISMSEDVMPPAQESPFFRGLIDAYALGETNWALYTADHFPDRAAYRHLNRQLLALYLTHLRTRFATDKRLVQKAPNIGPRIAAIAELLPNAKFVVMVRDLRAVVASQANRLDRANRPLNLPKWVNDFVKLYRNLIAAQSALAGRLIFVRYEHLVTNADATMAEVASFLSIRLPSDIGRRPWQHKRSKEEASASGLDGRPVSTASLTRYETALTPDALRVLEDKRAAIEAKIGMPVFYDEYRTRGPSAKPRTADERGA